MKQRNFLKYFLVFLGFAIFFAIFYFLQKVDLEKDFLLSTSKIPSIRNYNSTSPKQAIAIFETYGALSGVALGLISFLVSLLFLGILKIIRLAKFAPANVLALAISYGAYLALAIELIYYENRYTVIANAIIFFIGYPLFNTVIATFVLICLIYLFSIIRKIRLRKITEVVEKEKSEDEQAKNNNQTGTIAAASLLLVLPFLLSGCSLIGGTEDLTCSFMPDSEHCFQGAAVDQGDADECEKIKQPAKFKDMGSNPPKDKCYLMIAQNTGDLSACKKIVGGLMSYTQEECILDASVENENPSGCQMLTGGDKSECLALLAPKMTPDKVLEIDSQIDIINEALKKGSDPELEKQLAGLQTKRKDTLAAMTPENKAEYNKQSDPLNKEIIDDWAVGTIDNVTKNKLIDMNERLKAVGSGLTKDQYTAVRDYYQFINDPANDIEKMDDAALAKDRLGDKFKNAVNKLKFWKSNDTSEEKSLDEQIRFYQRMSERQAGIDKGLSERETNYENTMEKVKEKVTEKGADMAKDKIIEEIFGEAAGKTVGITTKVLGEAIDEVQEEAKSAEFRGLVKAYDDGMAEELSKSGGNVDKAHAEVVKKLMADPYAYASGDSFAKYGNLVENKDCDGSNPHCIRKDVFWKAMKKSYNYQHQSQ